MPDVRDRYAELHEAIYGSSSAKVAGGDQYLDEPRDDHGRWAGAGGGAGASFGEVDASKMTMDATSAQTRAVFGGAVGATGQEVQAQKVAVMKSLASRLDGNPDWKPQAMMDKVDPSNSWHDPNGGGFYSLAHPEIAPDSVDSATSQNAAAYLTSAWATSASDNNTASLLVQKAANAEFGDGQWQPDFLDAGSPAETEAARQQLDDLWGNTDVQSSVRAYVQAEYGATQDYLAARGVTSVQAYRGMFTAGDSGDAIFAPGTFQENVTGNPLTSWSTRYSTAAAFAGGDVGRGYGSLLVASIPASRIVSLPLTGAGCLGETELLVASSPSDSAWVTTAQVGQDSIYTPSQSIPSLDAFQADVQQIQSDTAAGR